MMFTGLYTGASQLCKEYAKIQITASNFDQRPLEVDQDLATPLEGFFTDILSPNT